MSHVFGSRSTICQYKGVTRGFLHTNSKAEQLVILNTRNPLETHPLSFPLPALFPFLLDRPFPLPCLNPPPRPGYNARQIGDSIEHQRIHCVARCNRAKDQFKCIMEIDQTLWISCKSEPIGSCADEMIDANVNIKFTY